MNAKISKIVEDNLKRYVGGEDFFSAIDEIFSNDKDLLNEITNLILKNEIFDYLIVSGKFGQKFYKFIKDNYSQLYNKIIVVNGSLRKGKEIENFWDKFNINQKKIIFIDDSFYSGSTKNRINDVIKANNANLIRTYVFYDGSIKKENDVFSFYRYYDHF